MEYIQKMNIKGVNRMTREDFIKDLVENYDEIDTSDLQGIVMARCMRTGEDEDEILDEIYRRVG